MKNPPLISVIMSVYNEEQYVEKSIRSILKQTEQDFEIIIFDDCSTDATPDLIEGMHDDRIRLYRNTENCGLTRNLNKGLKLAEGKYIARMDGDDFSLPARFEKQIKYLEEHQDVMLISCWTQNFGASFLYAKLKENSQELKVRMLVRPVFAHPGFMMRRELIEKGYYYDETFRTAQDYDFASRVAEKFQIGMVQEVLLYYRVHEKQISHLAKTAQFNNADKVRERLWELTGVSLTLEEKKEVQNWAREVCPDSIMQYENAGCLIDKLLEANKHSLRYPHDVLEKTLKRLLYIWLIRSKRIGYLLAFPKVCGYQWKNMLLFIGEILRILQEKIISRGEQKYASAIIKAENL